MLSPFLPLPMDIQETEVLALAEPRTVPLTRAQAQNAAYWQGRVAQAEQALSQARECHLACLSGMLAGHVEGTWQIISVVTEGESPHLLAQPSE